MTRVLAGPYATQMLASMGAEVIKVEHVSRGDETREWGPPFIASASGKSRLSSYFAGVNAGKQGIGIDFKHPRGRHAVLELARRSDAVVENFPAGTLDKAGVGAVAMVDNNPDLVVASISGYGLTGSKRTQAAYDVAIQAESGHMAITGNYSEDSETKLNAQEVFKHGVATIDVMTGLHAQNAVLAALLDVQARRAELGLPLRAS